MFNQTTVTEFLLLGFSDQRELQILHVVIFLIAYMFALMGNLLVIMAVAFDHCLHTPMYFFLMNLSILDLSSISVTVPKSIGNSLLNTRKISYSGCAAQVFLFFFFATDNFIFLTIMAYDRYVAICKPLYYKTIMNLRVCAQMIAGAWICALLYSAMHTGNTFWLSFCSSNVIDKFFCDIPQILKLSCSDAYISELVILVLSACLFFIAFLFIVVSYINIFTAVFKIPSKYGRHKAYTTCLPHLTMISLFISTGIIAYVIPISHPPSVLDLIVDVLYSVLPPVMNPVIYSMRNKEIKAAVRKLMVWKFFPKRKQFSFLL
uniref:G-protein coupled receptors family 1 profile domain-containing protein n=1 Tax=Apteryx owenii TaxID=8824 RepID=A0A8B9P4I5_APTOW